MDGEDVFVFAAFVGTLVFMGAVLWKAGVRSAKPGQVDMLLIGAAAGPAEAHLWSTALKTAGITYRVVNIGDFYPTEGGTQPRAYEVWVRARDERRAREVLGL